MSDIRDYEWVENCQKNNFGDENHNLKSFLPSYMTREEFKPVYEKWKQDYLSTDAARLEKDPEEKKKRNALITQLINARQNTQCPPLSSEEINEQILMDRVKPLKRKISINVNNTKDFVEIFDDWKKDNPAVEIILFVCNDIHKFLKKDPDFFEMFASDNNVGVIIFSEFGHLEVRKPEVQKFMNSDFKLECISHDDTANTSEGMISKGGKTWHLTLDVVKGLWK